MILFLYTHFTPCLLMEAEVNISKWRKTRLKYEILFLHTHFTPCLTMEAKMSISKWHKTRLKYVILFLYTRFTPCLKMEAEVNISKWCNILPQHLFQPVPGWSCEVRCSLQKRQIQWERPLQLGSHISPVIGMEHNLMYCSVLKENVK